MTDEVKKLREALQPFADAAARYDHDGPSDEPVRGSYDLDGCYELNVDHLRAAREALG